MTYKMMVMMIYSATTSKCKLFSFFLAGALTIYMDTFRTVYKNSFTFWELVPVQNTYPRLLEENVPLVIWRVSACPFLSSYKHKCNTEYYILCPKGVVFGYLYPTRPIFQKKCKKKKVAIPLFTGHLTLCLDQGEGEGIFFFGFLYL